MPEIESYESGGFAVGGTPKPSLRCLRSLRPPRPVPMGAGPLPLGGEEDERHMWQSHHQRQSRYVRRHEDMCPPLKQIHLP